MRHYLRDGRVQAATVLSQRLYEVAVANPFLSWRGVGALVGLPSEVEQKGGWPYAIQAAVVSYCKTIGRPYPYRKR